VLLLGMTLVIALMLVGEETAMAKGSACKMLFAFDSSTQDALWQTVNDNVMGGRSSGGADIADGRLLFTGSINTDGGGFSSIRAALPIGVLEGMGLFKLRVFPDARRYQLILQTDALVGGRPVAYRADIQDLRPGEWSDGSVLFSELKPTVFGRQLPGPGFDASRARLLGIIIADARDGAFRFEIKTIQACPL
jgi:NADH dehydrogenase [ubiquinone] 1 alpha subcomplex assembly factor 1